MVIDSGGVAMQQIGRAEVADRVASAVVMLASGNREQALLGLASCLTANEVFGVQKLIAFDRGQCVRCGVWVPMNRVEGNKCLGCANSTRGMDASSLVSGWPTPRAVKP